MEKHRAPARRKRAVKKVHTSQWHLPHLMVAAGILVALVASIPVGAYLKASVLVAQDACPAGETGTPPNCSGANGGGAVTPPPPSEIDCGNGVKVPQGQQCPVQMMSCPNGSQVPQGQQCPVQMMSCPNGSQVPQGQQCPTTSTTSTGTYMCNGAMIPNSTLCTTVGQQSSSTMTEAQMQAYCENPPSNGIKGVWRGMSFNPSCLMPNMSGTTNPGTVPTMSYCNGMGMGWDAVNSRCTGTSTMTPGATMPNCSFSEYVKMGSTMTCAPRSNCSAPGHADYNTSECQGVRGMGTNPTADCWNEANFARHSSATCTAARAAANTMPNNQINTKPVGMIECPGKTPNGMPMYGRDQNECARMLAEQVKWMSQNPNMMNNLKPEDTMTTWCPSLNRMATANECAASAKVNMNSQPCPTFPTPNGQAASMAPCTAGAAMPFQQPMFDASQFRMQNGPQFNFDYDQLNKDWNVDLTQTIFPQMDFSKQRAASEVKRLNQEGKQVLSQLKQMSNEVNRVVQRSGNLTACPPIAKAQSGITTAQSLAQLLVSATAENLTQALAAESQLGMGGMGGGMGGSTQGQMPMNNGGFNNFGSQSFGQNNFNGGFGPQGGFNGPQNFGPQSAAYVAQSTQQTDMGYVDPQDTIMFKLQQAVGQSHMCEGVTFFVKDGQRFVTEIDRMFKQTKDAKALASLADFKAKVQRLVADPYSSIDFESSSFGGNPMQDLTDEMNNLRQDFGDMMQDFQQNQEGRGVCGALEGISQGLAGMKSQVPADLFGKATRLVSSGLASCKSGDVDSARDTMSSLERLKGQFMKYVTFDDEGDGDVQNGDESDLFGDLDTDTLLRNQGLDDDTIDKITDRLLAKMQDKIDAAINAATQPLLAKLATLESKFATDGALATRQAASLEYTAALPAKIQDALASDRGEILAVVAPLDATVGEVSKQLSATVQDQYKRLLDAATTRTCSAAGCEEIKKAIDAVNTAAESANTASGRAKILSTEIPTALSTVDQVLKSDRKEAYNEGRLAFKDQDETQWHAKYLAEAKDKGLFTGDTANADKATNVAEGVAILARAVAGGSENVGTTVDVNNPFVRQMPEWARPAATFLINEKGVDLAGIMGNKGADKPMTRIEMVRAAAEAFDLTTTDTSSADKFRDTANLPTAARDALGALAEAGVVSGQGSTGNFDPNGTLNRAAFVKITLGAEASAQ